MDLLNQMNGLDFFSDGFGVKILDPGQVIFFLAQPLLDLENFIQKYQIPQ